MTSLIRDDVRVWDGPICPKCGSPYIDEFEMGPGDNFRSKSHRCGKPPLVIDRKDGKTTIQGDDHG